MAFAQPSAISETSLGTAGVTINVQLPATIASGALIEINLAYENANLTVPDPGTPTGYTLKKSITTNSGKDAATFLYMKVADGTEGGTTVAFTTSMNCVVAAQARVWTAWVGTLANVIVSTGINVVSAGPNPDSVTTGGAAADNVFVVGMGIYVNLGTVSAYSTGYTGGTLTQAGDTTDGAGMATCYLESAAASDDPGAFTLSESERCHGYTYVIPPGTSGAGGGVEITVPLATISIAKNAPAVAAGASVQPPAAALSVTPRVPNVGTGVIVPSPAASLSVSGQVPAVGIGVLIPVPVSALTLSALAPLIASGASVQVPLEVLAINAAAPGVSSGVSIAVPAGALNVTGIAPGVGTGKRIAVPLHTLSLTPNAPGIGTGVLVAVPLEQILLTAQAPAVGTGVRVLVPVAAITVAGNAPGVRTQTVIAVPVALLSENDFAPLVAAGASVLVPLFEFDINANAPLVQAGAPEANLPPMRGFIVNVGKLTEQDPHD